MTTYTKYGPVSFYLFFIAFASAFNYYLTYQGIRLNGFLLMTYSIDTVEGWLSWWAIHNIVLNLDRKIPYGDWPIKRIVIQTLITTAVGLIIIILLTEIVSYIRKGHSASIEFYTLDIFIVIIWFLVLNGIYVGVHYFNELNANEIRRREDKKIKATGFLVKQGRQDLQILFEDIVGFYSEDGFTYLLTYKEKTFLIERSLDKIEKSVPEELFFRLNRRYLINRNSITGFKRIADGKLEVFLRDAGALLPTVPVSRIRAVDFKKWFRIEEN